MKTATKVLNASMCSLLVQNMDVATALRLKAYLTYQERLAKREALNNGGYYRHSVPDVGGDSVPAFVVHSASPMSPLGKRSREATAGAAPSTSSRSPIRIPGLQFGSPTDESTFRSPSSFSFSPDKTPPAAPTRDSYRPSVERKEHDSWALIQKVVPDADRARRSSDMRLHGMGTYQSNDVFWKFASDPQNEIAANQRIQEFAAKQRADTKTTEWESHGVILDAVSTDERAGYVSFKFSELEEGAEEPPQKRNFRHSSGLKPWVEVRVPLMLHHEAEDRVPALAGDEDVRALAGEVLVFRKLEGIADSVKNIETLEKKLDLQTAADRETAYASGAFFTLPDRAFISEIMGEIAGVQQNDLGCADATLEDDFDVQAQADFYDKQTEHKKAELDVKSQANILPGNVSEEGYRVAYFFDLDKTSNPLAERHTRRSISWSD